MGVWLPQEGNWWICEWLGGLLPWVLWPENGIIMKLNLNKSYLLSFEYSYSVDIGCKLQATYQASIVRPLKGAFGGFSLIIGGKRQVLFFKYFHYLCNNCKSLYAKVCLISVKMPWKVDLCVVVNRIAMIKYRILS